MILYRNFKILTRHYLYPILYIMSDEEDPLALHNAIQNHNTLDEIRELISSGIDVNKQDEWGKTALMFTAEHGGEHGAGIMRLLVDAGADANKQHKDGRTALMVAARSGGEHAAGMMRLLVDAGADANKQECYGWTALMCAARWGGEHGARMLRVLVDAGADANEQDEDGRTALMIAAQHGGEHAAAMINLLVDTGVDIDKQDKCGFTALIFATMHEHPEEVVRLLVACGATLTRFHERNPDTTASVIKYINGALNWSPLHRAADARDADAIIKCMSEGMRPDAVVESSHQEMCTALSIAESTSYPTAQPVCDDCLALLRPSLMKSSTPSGSLFGGGGGSGVGGAQK